MLSTPGDFDCATLRQHDAAPNTPALLTDRNRDPYTARTAMSRGRRAWTPCQSPTAIRDIGPYRRSQQVCNGRRRLRRSDSKWPCRRCLAHGSIASTAPAPGGRCCWRFWDSRSRCDISGIYRNALTVARIVRRNLTEINCREARIGPGDTCAQAWRRFDSGDLRRGRRVVRAGVLVVGAGWS